MLIKKLLKYYRTSAPAAPYRGTEEEKMRYYRKLRWSAFLAGTIGYSLYYVCRTTLNVVKQPIMEAGLLDAKQLGVVGSALLFSYAIGKFVNGFLADHSNIKRFMATGLLVSACANLCVGILGLSSQWLGVSSLFFLLFAIMWGINGWAQSMGAPPAIIALSRWFPLKVRGTYYGFFSASHNLGEGISFLVVGAVVGLIGWQWGFLSASLAGFAGVLIIVFFLHDTPESKGLPPVHVLTKEDQPQLKTQSVSATQKQVLTNPFVWILALSSSFMYISRYAINGWGVLFLQEAKGFALENAAYIISINAFFGILGTVFSGWLSDKLFRGKRNLPALLFGILNTLSLCLFMYCGDDLFLNILSMVLFGTAIGVLICFLGGLMAVDIVPRNATGAALGVVGIASYIGAGIQDVVSGWLIESDKIRIDGIEVYSFDRVAWFWIGASVLSFILILFVWKAKKSEV